MRAFRSSLWLAAPIVAFVALFSLFPVAYLFLTSAGGPSGIVAALNDPLDIRAIENSVLQGGLSAALAVAIGYPTGVFLGRYRWPGRSTLRALLLIPFLLPSLVVVLGVRDLFGPAGLASSLLPGLSWFGAGIPGIVAVNLLFNVPIVAVYTAVGCEAANPDLEDEAATLGASPLRAYADVWGPASWAGAAVGGLVTFVFSALAFAAPLLVCGPRCYTLEARVWALDQILLSPGEAAALALIMVGLLVVPTGVYLALLSRLRRSSGQRPPRPRPIAWRSPPVLALLGITAGVVVTEAALLGAVLYTSLASAGGALGVSWSELFGARTTAVLGLSAGAAVGNTFLFATLAGLTCLLLVVAAGFATARRPRAATWLGFLLFVPLLVSPVLLALALATFWRPLLGGESNVWALIVISQATLGLPFALQSLELPLSGLTSGPREAALTLGASPWVAFSDTDLPRVRSGVVAAGLFAFAIGLGEFTATYFLATPAFTTLSVASYRLAESRLTGPANAAAGLLLLVSLVAMAAVVWGGRRGRD